MRGCSRRAAQTERIVDRHVQPHRTTLSAERVALMLRNDGRKVEELAFDLLLTRRRAGHVVRVPQRIGGAALETPNGYERRVGPLSKIERIDSLSQGARIDHDVIEIAPSSF